MSVKDTTKQIQDIVGKAQDGIYGKNTAYGIIEHLDFNIEELTTIIQKKVGSQPDGIYGKNTAREVLRDLGGSVEEPEGKPDAKVGIIYPEVYKQTPNISSYSIKPEGVVLHHSCGSYEGGVSWILQSKSRVSYHVLIDRDGSRTVFAKDTQRVWHAGKSSFNNRTNCNGFMLGLAFTYDTNKRELTDAEVNSAVEWLLPKFKKWGWSKDLSTVTTHRHISPGRKDDVDERAEKRVREALQKALG